MRVLVTGSTGFIGKNLCAQLEQESVEVLQFNRSHTLKDLASFINKADFVFHLAGINRPIDEAEFDKGNRELTETILKLIEDGGNKTPIVMTSSTQAKLDNPYGVSKEAAEKSVFKWSKLTGGRAYVYRLPNVFGKWAKPNYNSVVATFCHNIANGLDITINDPGTELNLVYIDDVVDEFIKTMKGKKSASPDGFCYIDRQFKISLQELANKINKLKASRESLIIPNFENEFDRFLYATFTSYFSEKDFGYNLEMKRDERGWLAEFIKSAQFGQVFISRTKPGIARGNHWHHTKIEKFLVLDGEAEIKFRNLLSQKIFSYKVNGTDLKVVDVPAGYVHAIKNTGKVDLLTLFWSDEIFNPAYPDTYFQEV